MQFPFSKMSRARLFVLSTILLLIITLLFSCDSKTKKSAKTKEEPVDRIKISGSGTCTPLLKKLAKVYESKHPESRIVFLPSGHSSFGIKGTAGGTLDIGAVSRELKAEEKKYKLNYYLVSNDGLVMAVHPSVKITDIDTQQVRNIYNGKIRNWKELEGQDGEIVVLDRNEDESAKIILRKYVLETNLEIAEKAIPLFYESDMVETLTTTPNTIGYLSLGYAISENLKIRVLSLDGVEATVENIQSGKYRMIRPLGIVVKGPPKGLKKDFIKFIFSIAGQRVMTENGFAPAAKE